VANIHTLGLNGVPQARLRAANRRPVGADGRWVLYWMVTARRPRFNFALERAAAWSRHLGLPLVVLEALRSDYPWASDRLHRFVLDGMADNVAAFEQGPALYYPYVEPEPGAGRGLLEALASSAAVVVTDHFPTFFVPRMVTAAARRLPVLVETVDGNGLLPLDLADREFATAHAFRRFLQRHLADHLEPLPLADPLADLPEERARMPAEVLRSWPPAPRPRLVGPQLLKALPIDHDVPAAPVRGGFRAAATVLDVFLKERLGDYSELARQPDADATSGLSPYLHFGHVAVHEVFVEVMRRAHWTIEDVSGPADGRRSGWWGARASVEQFLDQLVTWRELGYQFCHHRPDHDRYTSLPDWARRTLAEHAADPREHLYSCDELAAAATHDHLWNAAQRQLTREGRLHTYLRMLWGKKILEWSPDPETALATMIELNNRYALDGRDPNSTSGIFWVLGRHDRPWGPERPIFGKVRYMSSANTARKLRVAEYLERYA